MIPTYTIDGYEVAYASYQQDSNPNFILFWGANYEYLFNALNTDPRVDTYLNTYGQTIRPWRPDYHKWDDVNSVWILDQEQYIPKLIEQLEIHREMRLQESSLVYMTWDEGGPNEEVLGCRTDQRTLTVAARKAGNAEHKIASETDLVNFVFADHEKKTDSNAAVRAGCRDVDTAFLQAFSIKLDDVEQKHFDAFKHVLEVHSATPFTDITFEDPKEAYDDYIANN